MRTVAPSLAINGTSTRNELFGTPCISVDVLKLNNIAQWQVGGVGVNVTVVSSRRHRCTGRIPALERTSDVNTVGADGQTGHVHLKSDRLQRNQTALAGTKEIQRQGVIPVTRNRVTSVTTNCTGRRNAFILTPAVTVNKLELQVVTGCQLGCVGPNVCIVRVLRQRGAARIPTVEITGDVETCTVRR